MVKAGYKQTEIGVIPEDWEIQSIESLVPNNKKYGIVDGPFGSNLKTIHYKKKGIPIITSGYVTSGRFLADEYIYVDLEKFQQEKRSAVYGGDIVMAKIGANCGASAILPSRHQTGILSGNALKITIDTNKHIPYYVWQILWNLYQTGKIDELRTVGAQPAISMANLKKYVIPIPNKEEQKAIANALSDVDALITSLEKLIAKKENIKIATMQQLLTGKKRLNGFSGKWEEKKLGDIASFHKGKGLPKSQLSIDGKYKCIHYGELFTTYKEIVNNIQSFTNYCDNTIVSTKNDILMPTSDVTPNGLATASCIQEDGIILGGDILIIRPNNNILDGRFFAFYISIDKNQIMQLISGSTVYHLYGSDMAKFVLNVPPTIEEQQAIAKILSDMDNEIEALKTKLSKTKAMKDGMMSELLSGKTRLKV